MPTDRPRCDGAIQPAWRSVCAVVIIAALAIAGCGGGGDGTDATDDQPGPGATQFVSGRFDELVLLPSMEAVGPIRRTDGVTTRTYEIPDFFPLEALRAYVTELEGWTTVEPIERVSAGAEAYQAVYTKDAFSLVVTTSPAPTLDDDISPTQISVTLYEPGTEVQTADT